MIYLTIYLNGETSECGYKYVITKDFSSWTAFKTDNEFRYFLQYTGLKINPENTQVYDGRNDGRPSVITTSFYHHNVDEYPFWNTEEIPNNAVPFIGLSNGSYVNCYSVIEEEKTTLYKPNPNAYSVYVPYDYRETQKRLKRGVFLNGYKNTVDNAIGIY